MICSGGCRSNASSPPSTGTPSSSSFHEQFRQCVLLHEPHLVIDCEPGARFRASLDHAIAGGDLTSPSAFRREWPSRIKQVLKLLRVIFLGTLSPSAPSACNHAEVQTDSGRDFNWRERWSSSWCRCSALHLRRGRHRDAFAWVLCGAAGAFLAVSLADAGEQLKHCR